jgi:hypothetical protein
MRIRTLMAAVGRYLICIPV